MTARPGCRAAKTTRVVTSRPPDAQLPSDGPAQAWRVGREVGDEDVSEEHDTYNAHQYDFDGGPDGLQRIDDVLRQLIEERGWPLPVGFTTVNGVDPRDNGFPPQGHV